MQKGNLDALLYASVYHRVFETSWELSYAIEPKETADSTPSPDHAPRTPGSRPLRAYVNSSKGDVDRIEPSSSSFAQRFPSQISLESLATSNNNGHSGSTIVSDGSLRSSPSSTSLDKLSNASNHSFYRLHFQPQQLKPEKVTREFHLDLSSNSVNNAFALQQPHVHHSRSSSASSFLTSSNGSSSQGYISATASPTISAVNSTALTPDNDTIIAKVQFAGKNDLLYKKVRVNIITDVYPVANSRQY